MANHIWAIQDPDGTFWGWLVPTLYSTKRAAQLYLADARRDARVVEGDRNPYPGTSVVAVLVTSAQ